MTVMMHHQTAMRLRQQFRTVHNPLVRAHATDARNKRNLSEKKDDAISTKRKQQRDEGRIRALKYFTDIKDVELTWAESIFNDGVGVDSADVGRVEGKRGPWESL